MSSRTAQMLTKRRAVDFCRVATALCTATPVFAAV
ncbi:MAG: putative leader peptide [Trebonia sp.]